MDGSLIRQTTPAMADTTRINLEKINDISKAEKLHEQLEGLLPGAAAIEIDGAAVERIDTSNLQLLVAFKLAAGRHHVKVSLTQPSDALREAARLTGLTEHLGIV